MVAIALAPIPRLKQIRYNLAPADNAQIEAEPPKYKKPTATETEEALSQWVAFAQKCSVRSGRKLTKFDPYGFQKELFRCYWQHGLLIIGKPRQHGLTESVANILLWQAVGNPAFSAAIFSKGQDDTSKIARRVKRMANSHGGFQLDRANDKEISITGGGTIHFLNAKPDAPRSLESIAVIVLDEAAFIDKADDIWGAATGTQEMVGEAAKQIIISTPPPPEDDEKRKTFYIKTLTADNGDRDVVKIANQMRAGELGPVQHWVDEEGACKFLVHWKAHPIYSKQSDRIERVRKKYKIPLSVANREHDLAFDERQESGIVDIKWFERYSILDLPDNPMFTLQSWDTASTANKGSSYTAGITLMFDGGRIYIVDLVHKQLLSPDVEAAMRAAANKWQPNLIIAENKSSAIDIIPRLQRDSFFRYPVTAIEPAKVGGTGVNVKVLRFEQELPAIRDERKVLIPEELRSPEWLGTFLSTISKAGIPGAAMDVPDALSQALRYWRLEYVESNSRGGAGFGMRLGGQQAATARS